MQRELPAPGQESVWDYPRPPACVPADRHVVIRLGDTLVAETRDAYRVLETSHPPTWYLPRAAVADGLHRQAGYDSLAILTLLATALLIGAGLRARLREYTF